MSTYLDYYYGTCVNNTQGWWTYEYCFPQGLSQFHRRNNDASIVETMYSLGVAETWFDDVFNLNRHLGELMDNGDNEESESSSDGPMATDDALRS